MSVHGVGVPHVAINYDALDPNVKPAPSPVTPLYRSCPDMEPHKNVTDVTTKFCKYYLN